MWRHFLQSKFLGFRRRCQDAAVQHAVQHVALTRVSFVLEGSHALTWKPRFALRPWRTEMKCRVVGVGEEAAPLPPPPRLPPEPSPPGLVLEVEQLRNAELTFLFVCRSTGCSVSKRRLKDVKVFFAPEGVLWIEDCKPSPMSVWSWE